MGNLVNPGIRILFKRKKLPRAHECEETSKRECDDECKPETQSELGEQRGRLFFAQRQLTLIHGGNSVRQAEHCGSAGEDLIAQESISSFPPPASIPLHNGLQ